jgi:hypothetical protein
MTTTAIDSITLAKDLGITPEAIAEQIVKVLPNAATLTGFFEGIPCYYLPKESEDLIRISLSYEEQAALYKKVAELTERTKPLPSLAIAELTEEFKIALAFVTTIGVEGAVAYLSANKIVLARTGVDCHTLVGVSKALVGTNPAQTYIK